MTSAAASATTAAGPRWPDAEWLEAGGDGTFASGTVGGIRTRRYHALLMAARTPPTGRVVLVSGFEAWLETAAGRFPLSTQRYGPDVVYPAAREHLVAFDPAPWPRWTFVLPDGTRIVHECCVARDEGSVVLGWRRMAGTGIASLSVRPLVAGRDYHALTHENPAFDFTRRGDGGNAAWRPYRGVPGIVAASNGVYTHAPQWYRNFLYVREIERGLDGHEDLASPGIFTFDLAAGEALLVLRAGDDVALDAATTAGRLRAVEAARRARRPATDLAADAYVVRRGAGATIIAGYPWFTDWGRDTFIAMRGLVLERRQFAVAARILDAWSGCVSAGMLPNRFPDGGAAPEYNAVDASLWFVVVVHQFLAAAPATAATLRDRLLAAVAAILDGYAAGTRFGIRCDDDGLLACGVPGVQLTWMDARVDDRCITSRIGKPVEIQALWINALRLAGGPHAALADRAQQAFRARFWNEATQCLYDVVDADHVPGNVDPAVRPNQLFAVGGLPFPVVGPATARAIVTVAQRDLLTPMGLRTLAPGDPAYRGRYDGDGAARDAAYHQGTAWPWLIGVFVDAWLAVHGDGAESRAEARRRFLAPLDAWIAGPGMGHLPEIADGDAPHATRGCPFQAWSLGEYLRACARTAPP